MSRIIVKNLPLTLSDEKFRERFAEHGGVITDCKLMKTRNGTSRRFGFIGFRSAQDAAEAVKYFNRTFIGMAKIEVALAEGINDSTAPKARRELIKDVSHQPIEPNSKISSKRRKLEREDTENIDPKLREYLLAMRPRANERTWANDDISGLPMVPISSAVIVPEFKLDNTVTDGEPFDKLDKRTSRPYSHKEISIEAEEESILDKDHDEEAQLNLAATEISDDEWLRQRRKRIVDASNPVTSPNLEESSAINGDGITELVVENETTLERSEEEVNLESIQSTRRLFVRNLSYACSEEDLHELFGQHGKLEEVHVPLDSDTHNSKGFAYILFENGEDACNAYTTLDKQSFQGRLLHVIPGQPKRESKLDEFELAKLPLKKQQALKRKAAAAKNQFQWSSLYMNTDAVVGFLARKMGISKADLLDPESADAGVRQAMAEAHAIDDAKKYFESVGMDLKAFADAKAGRSDTVILVKNFPFETTVEELRDLFSEHGDVRRLLMPSSNTIAVIEMANAPQARAAFAKLAYRRFKSSILYLEKAPKNLLSGNSPFLPVAPSARTLERAKEVKPSVSEIVQLDEAEADDQDYSASIGSTSLFVKNLSFKTRASDLAAVFSPLQDYIRAEVKMKMDPKHKGTWLSMGFGFVEFKTKDSAELARKTMTGFVLDGHSLQIKLSTRGSDSGALRSDTKSKTAPKTKIIIKNLPFETTKKDIRQLLGAFGQLRTVRLPKKFDNTARGFAFAEFVSAKEAENAMNSLAGVHLLGRRLVLQYATQDATSAEMEIERMQSKVRKQVAGETLASYRLSGKRKFNIDDNNEDVLDA
ncbi:hypothetical protein POJ06DRAFT_247096 [Lipomyces tetrasporus]|uniref:Multiple RNA-binding domain-containing protein 1 n=1 Tax=Lipomyces tetrasporus TaxID=54092 RepID=A0AAD7VUM3_9ASCO|nr:uncharacterized protein POJ06DRAFT_247096 [Lipomyces tetrasporus]KAJ8103282.1 hypothetical protein POJ06DRAFT_247096 [Lipomyces tetrasporus]